MTSKVPYASVIVPCYNEEERIRDCLLALIKQECYIPYEIIVVDDGSNDGTCDQVKAFIREAVPLKGINVKLIVAEHGGPARARNIGIKNAVGELILFVDADCVANPFWLRTLTRRMKDEVAAGVGGTYRTRNPESKVACFIGLDIEYRHMNMGTYTDFLGSYNACFEKSVLMEVGGFDESFTEANAEDNDLCYRILERGYTLIYEPAAWVIHHHPSTIRQFIKQQFRRAMWRVFLYKKNPKRVKGDRYAGLCTLVQPLLLGLISFLILLWGLISKILFIALVAALLTGAMGLIGANARLLSWIYRKQRSTSFTVFSFAMIVLRVITWCLGAAFGLKFLVKHS